MTIYSTSKRQGSSFYRRHVNQGLPATEKAPLHLWVWVTHSSPRGPLLGPACLSLWKGQECSICCFYNPGQASTTLGRFSFHPLLLHCPLSRKHIKKEKWFISASQQSARVAMGKVILQERQLLRLLASTDYGLQDGFPIREAAWGPRAGGSPIHTDKH